MVKIEELNNETKEKQMKKSKFGTLNEHAVGIILKELVRRAIIVIRAEKLTFEVSVKEGIAGRMDDVLTTADQAAQDIYIRSIVECFPHAGVIAEENSLKVECSDRSGYYFTVDPLDGTKAFVRRQSHGVGTMISLSLPGKFVSAYVGDVNTQEIYGFRPGSYKVHRITEFHNNETLTYDDRDLADSYVLLRDPESTYSSLSQDLISRGLKNQLVDGGSIGIWFARLWKGEVGALLIDQSIETPWDSNPVNAISLKLGFRFLRPSARGNNWELYTPRPIKRNYDRKHETLVVHRNALSQIRRLYEPGI